MVDDTGSIQFKLFPEDGELDEQINSALGDIKTSELPAIAVVSVSRSTRQVEDYGIYAITRNGSVACRVSADLPALAAIKALEAVEDARGVMLRAELRPKILSFEFAVQKAS